MNILLVAAERGFDWSALDAPLALALARATRNTLQAEEQALKHRILECEGILAALKDSHDNACARVDDANHQVGSIMSIFDREGLSIDVRLESIVPTTSLLIKYGIDDQPSDDERSYSESDLDADSDSSEDRGRDSFDSSP